MNNDRVKEQKWHVHSVNKHCEHSENRRPTTPHLLNYKQKRKHFDHVRFEVVWRCVCVSVPALRLPTPRAVCFCWPICCCYCSCSLLSTRSIRFHTLHLPVTRPAVPLVQKKEPTTKCFILFRLHPVEQLRLVREILWVEWWKQVNHTVSVWSHLAKQSTKTQTHTCDALQVRQ